MIGSKTFSLPACAFSAGLMHVAFAAAVLPLAITLPAPGTALGPRNVVVNVAIRTSIGEGDTEFEQPTAMAAAEIERAPLSEIAGAKPIEPASQMAEADAIEPTTMVAPDLVGAVEPQAPTLAEPDSTAKSHVVQAIDPLASAIAESGLKLLTEEPVQKVAAEAELAGTPAPEVYDPADLTSALPLPADTVEPDLLEVDVREVARDDAVPEGEGPDPATSETVASVALARLPPLPVPVDREAWLRVEPPRPAPAAAPAPAKPKVVRALPKPAKPAKAPKPAKPAKPPKPAKAAPPSQKGFLGLGSGSRPPAKRPSTAKADDRAFYKGSWGALLGAPVTKPVDTTR
ncbi:MAG: hypothetical protein ACREDO_02140 [Methyloceanibacter sp.]